MKFPKQFSSLVNIYLNQSPKGDILRSLFKNLIFSPVKVHNTTEINLAILNILNLCY